MQFVGYRFNKKFTDAICRVPMMKKVLLEKLSNGAEAFSPDGKWVLGKSSEKSAPRSDGR